MTDPLPAFPKAARPARWPLVEGAALALSVIWVAAVLGYFWRLPDDAVGPGVLMTLLILCLPLIPVWATVVTLRAMRTLRDEAAHLRATVEAMRRSATPPRPAAATVDRPSIPDRPVERGVPVTFTSRREAAPPVPLRPEEQASLSFGLPADAPPPVIATDFIRAVQFPEDANDREGFRAMRAALADRTAAKLIRAAQDVLTLLSQEGIYTDDLTPDLAQPDVWRRFAGGERGRSVADLGGVRDIDVLAAVAVRMREDAIFRDAAHHFLRSFDRAFAAFEKQASDAELMAMSDTRTARAFMLIGRVAGTFD
jgi:hypothetical protein